MTDLKYVVTGAGGFIGYHLANALAEEGAEVVGVDLYYPDADGPMGPPRFDARVGDFRDSTVMHSALEGATILFHLASVHLQISLDEEQYWDVNVHSLPDLLRSATQAGVRRCVHTSSVGVYGDVGSAAADERTESKPQSIYGRTKLAGEQTALQFGRENAMEMVVLRPAWVFGPGCPRSLKICRALRKRRFVMIGAGQNMRHPIYIKDMIEAFRLSATQRGAVGHVMNIAGPKAVTSRELIDAFCRAFALPAPPVVPYALGASVAACAESVCSLVGREPPISRRTLEFFNTNNTFDISLARKVIHFEPQYSLQQGLEEMASEQMAAVA